MSLDDVRAAIDRIDDQIVALLAQRQEQVVAAATFTAMVDAFIALELGERRTRGS